MSLNWSVEKIKNFKQLVYRKSGDGFEVRKTAEVIIMSTMLLGMGEITEKNCEEFFQRMYVWEKCNGCIRYETGKGGVPFTLEEIRSFIGLETNASNMTDAQFKSHLYKKLKQDARREMARQKVGVR